MPLGGVYRSRVVDEICQALVEGIRASSESPEPTPPKSDSTLPYIPSPPGSTLLQGLLKDVEASRVRILREKDDFDELRRKFLHGGNLCGTIHESYLVGFAPESSPLSAIRSA